LNFNEEECHFLISLEARNTHHLQIDSGLSSVPGTTFFFHFPDRRY